LQHRQHAPVDAVELQRFHTRSLRLEDKQYPVFYTLLNTIFCRFKPAEAKESQVMPHKKEDYARIKTSLELGS
jgi:hypothetical protein